MGIPGLLGCFWGLGWIRIGCGWVDLVCLLSAVYIFCQVAHVGSGQRLCVFFVESVDIVALIAK